MGRKSNSASTQLQLHDGEGKSLILLPVARRRRKPSPGTILLSRSSSAQKPRRLEREAADGTSRPATMDEKWRSEDGVTLVNGSWNLPISSLHSTSSQAGATTHGLRKVECICTCSVSRTNRDSFTLPNLCAEVSSGGESMPREGSRLKPMNSTVENVEIFKSCEPLDSIDLWGRQILERIASGFYESPRS